MLEDRVPAAHTIGQLSTLDNKWLPGVPIKPTSLHGLQSRMFTGWIGVLFSL